MNELSELGVYVFDLIGVAVFAISGALEAGRRRLDLIGVFAAAAATAVGGGTIRDLLLDRHPIFWLTDGRYVLVIVGATLVTVLFARRSRAPTALIEVADALGLALFAVTGARVAEDAGMPLVASVLLGAVTGVAGGVIRDVLLAQVPHIFRPGSLYATAAIAGASVFLVLERVGVERPIPTLSGIGCAAALRVASIALGLELPTFEVDEQAQDPTSLRELRRKRVAGKRPPDG